MTSPLHHNCTMEFKPAQSRRERGNLTSFHTKASPFYRWIDRPDNLISAFKCRLTGSANPAKWPVLRQLLTTQPLIDRVLPVPSTQPFPVGGIESPRLRRCDSDLHGGVGSSLPFSPGSRRRPKKSQNDSERFNPADGTRLEVVECSLFWSP